MDVEHHLTAFVRAFVEPSRRDRWLFLLAAPRKNTHPQSHKLMDALDPRYCRRADGTWDLDASLPGVYYAFSGDPEVITLAEAEARGRSRDAIFSIEPGALVIHFSHEGWAWLCRRA